MKALPPNSSLAGHTIYRTWNGWLIVTWLWGVKRTIFLWGVCRADCCTAALEHCHLMTSGGGIFPSMCASMFLSQVFKPCYIFLHSFPPVLSFTLGRSRNRNQLQTPRIKWWTCLTRLPFHRSCLVLSLSVNLWYISCGRRWEPTWRGMWHPQLFPFCYFFSTPIFWTVS